MANIVEAVLNSIAELPIIAGRDIGGVIPDVTVEEIGRDSTFITNHPVERGAAITDHAFMMPVEVEMQVCWSDSSGGFEGYSTSIYGALQSLQQTREPFEVVTGKRVYSNMLISSLEVTTNATSEWALVARVVLREVIIVDTQTTSAVIAPSTKNQAQPQTTAPPVNMGTQQLKPTTMTPGDLSLAG